MLSVAWGLRWAWPTPISVSFNQPNITVSVIEGDLFDQQGHLAVGMSDTFDTAIPTIIDRKSVQGQFLDRHFNGDVAALDRRLTDALADVTAIGTVAKEGKTDRFPLGTVAVIREATRCFFCVAYTVMNEHNEARGTPGGVWTALDNLWREVSRHGNGGRLSIPVIGGGQARMSQVLPQQDSIRFVVLSFLLASRVEKICDELVIVVRPSDFRKLDRLELQAFLRSLRPS